MTRTNATRTSLPDTRPRAGRSFAALAPLGALLALFAVAPERAAAGDDFDRGFERELGRQVARETVRFARFILIGAPDVRVVYREPAPRRARAHRPAKPHRHAHRHARHHRGARHAKHERHARRHHERHPAKAHARGHRANGRTWYRAHGTRHSDRDGRDARRDRRGRPGRHAKLERPAERDGRGERRRYRH